jgi:hypothetical protein
MAGSAVADERASRSAGTGHFALELGGVRHGLVHAVESAEKSPSGQPYLVLGAQDVPPSLAAVVDTFLQGKPLKKDVRLTSGAVVRKANDARLVSVKLPALGSGTVADLELTFAAPSVTTQPLLSAKESPAPPASARITTFRVGLTGMQAIEAPKLDAITVTQKADGTASTGEIGLEVAAGGAPPFVAWQKASNGKPAPRAMHIEYVGSTGTAILELRFDRCTPSSVKPLGASATTHITLACASLHGS